VAAGAVAIDSSAVTGNTAQGGVGGTGSTGKTGASGGTGGDGLGGGLYAAGGNLMVHGTTMTSNTAAGGAGGSGSAGANGANKKAALASPGKGVGGGLYIALAAAVGLDAYTSGDVANNHASTSDNDIFGAYSLIV
jgi:hypothetical protein